MNAPKLTWGLEEIDLRYGYFYEIVREHEENFLLTGSDYAVPEGKNFREHVIVSNRPGYDPGNIGGPDKYYGIVDYFTMVDDLSHAKDLSYYSDEEGLADDKEPFKEKKHYECKSDKTHVTRVETMKLACEIFGGIHELPMIIPMKTNCDYLFINGNLAEQIKKSGLTGFKLLEIKRFYHNDINGELDNRKDPQFDVYLCEPTAKSALQFPVIEPPEANKCPFCGFKPLICLECGHRHSKCLKCKRFWPKAMYIGDYLPKEEMQYKNHPGLIKKADDYNPLAEFINPHLWRGADFFGYRLVTWRVVNWLLSVHAAPFKAIPVPVNVAGLNKEHLKKLQKAREPLLQKK